MGKELQQTIEVLAKEKGIEPDVIITAIEDAVLTASRKYYKTDEDFRTKFNVETGQVELFTVRNIVNEVTDPLTEISLEEAQKLYGDEAELDMAIEFPKATDVLGRIAAQAAKQVIFQKVREAQREHVYAEFGDREGEVINGTVKRFESGDIIIEMGRVEALLPRKEQSRAENYTVGDRVRAVIKGVNRGGTKGPQIILSRTDPALLIKLFEQEVPEIYDGTVQIRGAVREAGDRAKIAVFSQERDIDPVGACVGMKGTRVQSIIRELRGEKIDIIEWANDVNTLITNAISPARIQSLSVVDEAERVVEVIVEDKQLSLAIGKKGQNVRLAAKLTGWKIDIKSEEDVRREVDAKFELAATLATVDGFTDAMWETLSTSELNTVDRLCESPATDIANLLSIDEKMATALQNATRVAAEAKAKLEQEAAEEAAKQAAADAAIEEAAKQAAADAAIEEAAKQAAADAAIEETPEQSTEEETDGTTDQLTEEEPSINEKAADESAADQA